MRSVRLPNGVLYEADEERGFVQTVIPREERLVFLVQRALNLGGIGELLRDYEGAGG